MINKQNSRQLNIISGKTVDTDEKVLFVFGNRDQRYSFPNDNNKKK